MPVGEIEEVVFAESDLEVGFGSVRISENFEGGIEAFEFGGIGVGGGCR